MVRKKLQIEPIRNDLPVYPISVAAKLLNVHPRTLRIYEDEGLVQPARKGTRRLFSPNDLTWIGCIRKLIHDDGISISGIKKLLRFASCYEMSDCPNEISSQCDAIIDVSIPRTLRLAGDTVAEKMAKEQEIVAKKQALSRKEEQKVSDKKVDRKIR